MNSRNEGNMLERYIYKGNWKTYTAINYKSWKTKHWVSNTTNKYNTVKWQAFKEKKIHENFCSYACQRYKIELLLPIILVVDSTRE